MRLFRSFRLKREFKRRSSEIEPDEIFLDSRNLPEFDRHQFEGTLERPISQKAIIFLSSVSILIALLFVGRLWNLQIANGQNFAARSENNRLNHTAIFANRGVIVDRNNVELVTNVKNTTDDEFAFRKYTSLPGFAHILGYLKYPTKDTSGFYYQHEFVGKDGAELIFNDRLAGVNGIKIVETDALGKVQTQGITLKPSDGENVVLSIDSRIQHELFKRIQKSANEYGFVGGTGILMDVRSGEILALTNFPEYQPQMMTDGDKGAVSAYLSDKNTPLLNRAVAGVYTPGSIIKPLVALGALEENVISPTKQIYSDGSLELQNPYDPTQFTVFKDWKAHGYVDMRQAIAMSSDVYFYVIGGGFEDQKGLGIRKIDEYAKMFGIESKTGINLPGETSGTIPTPEWKEKNFDGDAWRVGNTYHTAIGQYGFQVTPIEVARYIAAIANGGTLITPTIEKTNRALEGQALPIERKNLEIVQEGMLMSVQEGTAKGLDMGPDGLKIAGKTGTAELGISKEFVNSWTVGYFPYESPRYAYVIMMEKGPRDNLVGATAVMRQLVDWMSQNTSEYLNHS